jgi:hypothetical protein
MHTNSSSRSLARLEPVPRLQPEIFNTEFFDAAVIAPNIFLVPPGLSLLRAGTCRFLLGL